MAVDLKKFSAPDENDPVIMTIFGEPGRGKTTLAAMFPKPFFLRTEKGTRSIAGRDGLAAIQSNVIRSPQEAFDIIEALATQDHDFETLVVDSVTQLAVLIEEETLKRDGRAKNLNQAFGGFGNGFDVAAYRHGEFREYCEGLSEERGMHIVFIAHSKTETMNPPDGDPYTRYTIDMHKKAVPHYVNNVDATAHVRLKSYTSGSGDKKKVISTPEREIVLESMDASVCKNRFKIHEPLAFNLGAGNPFAPFLPKKG